MDIKDLLSEDAVLELREQDKARVLNEMARRSAAMLDLDHEAVLKAVTKREELGSTGVGNGIALPHARIESLKRPFGVFALLRPAVMFDAVDEQPVDLVFLVLIPETMPGVQLQPLACVARRLRDPALTKHLRAARGLPSLYTLLTKV